MGEWAGSSPHWWGRGKTGAALVVGFFSRVRVGYGNGVCGSRMVVLEYSTRARSVSIIQVV